MTTPAGWYPDPAGTGQQRYFDGTGWTSSYAPYPAPTPPSSGPPPPAQFVPTGERTSNRVLILRVLAGLAVVALITVGASFLTHTAKDIATTPDAGIGQPVSDGKFEFVVTNVYESGEFTLPQPRGTWVVVAMTVRNTGNQPQSFFAQNQKLIDAGGRSYTPDTMAAMSINNNNTTMVMDLGPGFSITARVPFDVPQGTTPDKIELHDSAYSTGATVKIDHHK